MASRIKPSSNGHHNNSPYGGFADPLILNRLDQMTQNITSLSRQSLMQQGLMDPRRSIDDECGYPDSATQINIELYKQLYDREAIATRVVEVMPKECWQAPPIVYENDDPSVSTEFEDAWAALEVGSQGTTYHREETGSSIWEYVLRGDIMCGIGHFGVILLGIDDDTNLQEPVKGSVVFNSRGEVVPDCFMTEQEERYIRQGKSPITINGFDSKKLDLPGRPLSLSESKIVDQWAQQRERIVENMRKSPVSNASQIYGTDRQYDMGLGIGMPLTSLGYSLAGTDQQYFGLQIGPSEKPAPQPVKKENKLVFLRVYDESLVQIVRYEWNIRNPRFGMPVMYRITLNDPREVHAGIGLPLATVFVHWSRVVHLVDNLRNSEIFGVPRMRPVLNRLLDLRKLYGGGAEGAWKGITPITAFETHPQLGGDVLIDESGMKDMMENVFNGLQRYVTGRGGSWKQLPPQVVDVANQIDKQIEAICIVGGYPKRVFCGSERGELASSQDDSKFNDRLSHRNNFQVTPRAIAPLIDRLITLGVLPLPQQNGAQKVQNVKKNREKIVRPTKGGWLIFNARTYNASNPKPESYISKGGYYCRWPDLESLSDKDKAAISVQKTQAICQYVQAGADSVIAPEDFFTKIMGMDDDEVESMMENAVAFTETEMGQHLEEAKQAAKPTPPGMEGKEGGGLEGEEEEVPEEAEEEPAEDEEE